MNSCRRHIENFIVWHYKRDDIFLQELADVKFAYEFAEGYLDYLLNVVDEKKKKIPIGHHTAIKSYWGGLNKIMKVAMEMGWMDRDPFANYKTGKKKFLKIRKRTIEYLTPEELDRLVGMEFTVPTMERVKDVFVFACYTSLAISDCQRLSEQYIHTRVDGNKWILLERSKTGTEQQICLFPGGKALEILEKYKNDEACLRKGKLLPMIADQNINWYLKTIQDAYTLQYGPFSKVRSLHFHVARRTCATWLLNNGASIGLITKWMGHSDIKTTTKYYAEYLDSQVLTDARLFEEKLKNDSTGNFANLPLTHTR